RCEPSLDSQRPELGHAGSVAATLERQVPANPRGLWTTATQLRQFADFGLWKSRGELAIDRAMCHGYGRTARLLSPQADPPGPESCAAKSRGPPTRAPSRAFLESHRATSRSENVAR